MLELFKKNVAAVSLLILPYILLLRSFSFMGNKLYVANPDDGYFNELVFGWFDTSLVQAIVGILLIYIQCLIINRIGIKHQINKDVGLLPGLFYGYLACLVPTETYLSPVMFANTFILLSLQLVLNTYNLKEVSKLVFLSGFLASCASMFYIPYLYFFFVTTVGMVIMRSFSLLERFQHLIGWLLPYFLVLVWQFYIGYEKLIFPHYFLHQFAFLQLGNINITGIKGMAFGVFCLIFILYFVFNYSNISSKKIITVQKKMDIFYWIMLFGFVVGLSYYHLAMDHFYTVAIGMAYLLAITIGQFKQPVIGELLHFILLAFLAYVQFF